MEDTFTGLAVEVINEANSDKPFNVKLPIVREKLRKAYRVMVMSTEFFVNSDRREPVGIRTFEKRRAVFTWMTNPITFLMFGTMNQEIGIVDEMGDHYTMIAFLDMLEHIKVHNYDKEMIPE